MRNNLLTLLALACWCIAWLCLAGAVLLVAFWALVAHGAPAPLPKVKAPPASSLTLHLLPRDFVGEWEHTWGSCSDWRVALSANGDYLAVSKGGETWTGRWQVDQAGRLHVAEALLDENGVRGGEAYWSVVWDREESGKFDLRRLHGNVVRPDGTVLVATIFVKKGKR